MNTTKIFDKVPKFTEAQLKSQVNKQINFLRAVYPYLSEDEWTDSCMEIRPLKRDKNDSTFFRSFNSYHLNEKDEQYLLKFMEHVNGKGVCLYYSVFTFNRDFQALRADGKPFQKGKINKQNALFTSVLVMDFDGITEDEYLEYKTIFKSLGIETWDIMSGHGYQLIILLDQKIYDKDILRKFTELLISRGFKADPAITDAARVMRLPYSFNCKALDAQSSLFKSGHVIPVQVLEETTVRYNIIDIFKKIGSLPIVIEESTPLTSIDLKMIDSNSQPLLPTTLKIRAPKNIEEIQAIDLDNLTTLYSKFLNIEQLDEPIQKMLNGTVDGLRNQVLMFLVPFLRNTLGFNMQIIQEIMTLWGERCHPSLQKDFIFSEINRIYEYGLRSKSGKYTTELMKAYGFFELDKYTRKNKVLLPNAVFEDFFQIPDGAIRIYLALHMATITKNMTNFTPIEISDTCGISARTFYRNIDSLTKLGYICKKRANKKDNKEYTYYINPYFNSTKGFVLLETATIELMFDRLTNGEIKLYSYLAHMTGSTRTTCFASQKYLAKKIGKAAHNSISMMTDSMHTKNFITKTTTTKQNIKHTQYDLNY
ncbi:MAG TPA: hypothetical protein GX707_12425 [Epulopiscium sp.]|nr:hypothetical protein [Candidatus Epulonipiscium sp.]